MTWIYRLSVRFPRLTVLLGLAAVGVCAPGVLRIRLRTDGHALVPRNHSAIAVDAGIRERFGVSDQVLISIETDHAQGVFNFETLGVVRDLTSSLPDIEGIEASDLISLATERSDRVYTGTLRFRPFLDPFPTKQEELDQLRRDMEDLRLFIGAVVSEDYRSTAVIVNVRSGLNRSRLVRDIHSRIAALGDVRERIGVVGAPVAESLLGVHILEDLGILDFLAGAQGLIESWFGVRILDQLHELELTGGSHDPLRRLIGALWRPLPMALAGVALIIWLTCRSVWGTMLPLMEVGSCLVIVFGVMGYAEVPFYLTMAVMPVILTAIGVADEIHIFSRYRQALGEAEAGPHPEPLLRAMSEMWRPVFKTSVTSCVGFGSFALSPLEPVRMFGIFTALGIGVCMVWSLTVIPASLALIDPRRFGARSGNAATGSAPSGRGFLRRATGGVLAGRWVVVAMAAVAVGISPAGIRKLFIQDSWVDGFAPESEFYQTTQRVNAGYRGTHILWLCLGEEPFRIKGQLPAANIQHFEALLPGRLGPEELEKLTRCSFRPYSEDAKSYRIVKAYYEGEGTRIETDRRDGPMGRSRPEGIRPPYSYSIMTGPAAILVPSRIEKIGRLEDMLESLDMVGGVLGTYDHLTTMHFMLRKREPEQRLIPEDRPRLLKLLDYYKLVRGPSRLREILGEQGDEALITIFLKNANFRDTTVLFRSIEEYVEAEFAPLGIATSLGGDVAVSQAMIPAIVETQVISLLLSLVGIVTVTTVLFGSVTAGVLCVLPPGMAVLFNYAFMGALGIPLGVATSMFCGMTLGLGVDYSIHLMERCRISFARLGDRRAGLGDAVSFAGPAIIIDAAAIAIGFGVLILSQVPANNRLGLLLVVSITSCLLVTLVLLPVLLSFWQPWFLRRALVGSAPHTGETPAQSSSSEAT